MLQVTNVQKRFTTGDSQVLAVDNVSFTVAEGAFVSIVGRSGSGKTTLLSLLGGLEKPTSGSIVVDGQDITQLRDSALVRYRSREIGFIFQAYNLVPNLTALENVLLPMEAARLPRAGRIARAQKLLEQVGLSADQMKRKPSRLSGGQQQRVAIARALAARPKVIFADEPTGNLDERTGTIIFELLRSLCKTEKATIVIVTHDKAIANKTDAVFHIKDGKLEETNV